MNKKYLHQLFFFYSQHLLFYSTFKSLQVGNKISNQEN